MKSLKLTGVSVLAAVAASLCCIAPALALFAGITGVTSSLRWMEPYRPYLIAVSVVALGFTWYQKLKTPAVDECGCEVEKSTFWQSKTFLAIITAFVILTLILPYLPGISASRQSGSMHKPGANSSLHYEVSGMTCAACENHITEEVSTLPGIAAIQVSYADGFARVEFDSTQTTAAHIRDAINATEYEVTRISKNQP